MEKTLNKENSKIIALFVVFLLLFSFSVVKFFFNISFPVTGQLGSLWYWNYILLGLISAFYVFKLHKFHIMDFITSVAFGIAMSLQSGFNPVIGSITLIAYYSACQIFRMYSYENKIFKLNYKAILNHIGFGILIGILPAILNVLEFYIQDGYTLPTFSMDRFFPAAVRALQPGISEEIVFRFFLYAFILNAFKGVIPKTKFVIVMTYALLIIPHGVMHYPTSDFITNPLGTVLNLIYMCCVFGVPSVWLLKRNSLYSAIAFHWFVDFIRFWIVGH